MNFRRMLAFALIFLAACAEMLQAQSWQPLINQPSFSPSTALLLTDGTVMVHDTGAQDWWRLTPDNMGSYVNGTWSQLASLPTGYSPLYYASAVLPDGRVIMNGGEYNFGKEAWTTLGAIYSPKTNKWRLVKPPTGWTRIGDAQNVVLPNGTYMLADCCTVQQALFNSKTLTWTATGTGKADINDEEGWTLLPDQTVLTVDANNTANLTNAEKYIPSTGSWINAGNTIVKLDDTNANNSGSHELGPAVLRPDGTVFATGATGFTSVYNPPANPNDPGTWIQGPTFPAPGGKQQDIADGPASLLPSGNVLVFASPGVFRTPSKFYEFDGTNLNAVPATPNAVNDSSYYGRMLVLPTGQILFTDTSQDVEIYTAAGSPNPAWAPTITKAPKNVIHARSYLISGTQFNGLSQGAAYGDDGQSATNYPLVRITNSATGHVFYARTYNHSTMAVATGSAIVSTHFTVPAGIELGASELEVVANGIPSTAVAVTVQ
ncbi:MAG TPA: kelch repeat-containing protein [Terriglobales bacterium]|nr:kelch repeat-containing protein [Terriglobales bacterium]